MRPNEIGNSDGRFPKIGRKVLFFPLFSSEVLVRSPLAYYGPEYLRKIGVQGRKGAQKRAPSFFLSEDEA
ncbi:hypothetical protein [Persicobacter diffluens]|uniref:hypothetical protein n=1 Tax=Persicobacter diffluens TaxID=981 RepID=UPI0030C74484